MKKLTQHSKELKLYIKIKLSFSNTLKKSLAACFCLLLLIQLAATETIWQEDIVQPSGKFKEGSHIKIYLPNLPYLAISHDINGALLRPAENSKGWVYDLATSHKNTNDQIWEFNLR